MEAHLRKTRDLENCKSKQKLGGNTELVLQKAKCRIFLVYISCCLHKPQRRKEAQGLQ